MTEDLSLVVWSEFARKGKEYANRIATGETFLILKDSKPFAIVRAIDPKSVQVRIVEYGTD